MPPELWSRPYCFCLVCILTCFTTYNVGHSFWNISEIGTSYLACICISWNWTFLNFTGFMTSMSCTPGVLSLSQYDDCGFIFPYCYKWYVHYVMHILLCCKRNIHQTSQHELFCTWGGDLLSWVISPYCLKWHVHCFVHISCNARGTDTKLHRNSNHHELFWGMIMEVQWLMALKC